MSKNRKKNAEHLKIPHLEECELKSHSSAKKNCFRSEMLNFITTEPDLGLDW